MANTNRKPVFSAEVFSLLALNNMAAAFSILRGAVLKGEHRDLSAELDKWETTYRSLLDYMATGSPDAGRDDMLSDIRGALRDVAQELDRRSTMIDDPRLYFSTARLLDLRRSDLGALLRTARELSAMAALAGTAGSLDDDLLRKKEEAYEALFLRLWTLGRESDPAVDTAVNILAEPDTPYDLSVLIISGLMLGLMQYYDSHRLRALCEAYLKATDERLAARLLVALVLVVRRWSERIRSDRQVIAALESLRDSLVSYRRLREVALALIRTRDTERVSAKMRDELIPDLMKIKTQDFPQLREGAESLDISDIEGNPEWEEMLVNSGIADKMRELSEMQSQGADLLMAAFSNLKSFPFFRSLVNWFIPYSTSHSSINSFTWTGSDIVKSLLEENTVMCDSDRFSFIFALNAMPSAQRDMAMTTLSGQLKEYKEAMAGAALKSTSPVFDSEVSSFLRNLYRFYRLFNRHADFSDPFRKSFVFSELPVIGDILSEPEILTLVGEFYFKRGYYREALPMLRSLAEAEGADPLLWEKTGYCLEALEEYPAAIECYVKAELFNPDKLWTVRRLSEVYVKAGKVSKAAPYARRVVESDPEDIKALLTLADIENSVGNLDLMLKALYKADYIAPDRRDIWTRIVLGESRSGQPAKARKYLAKLLSDAPTPDDYMLAGHLALAEGDLRQAASMYRQSIDPTVPVAQWRARVLDSASKFPGDSIDLQVFNLLLDKLEYDFKA